MDRADFCKPQVRPGIIEKLKKDAEELRERNETRPILLSFTTDPYQELDVKEQLTRKAIKILHSNNLKVSILTKGGQRSERDFDLLASRPELSEYGVTLVFTDESWRKKIEPCAPDTIERISSLKIAHDMGIRTYVSLEPVWFADESLKLIDMTHDYVDLYKVGKLNYNKQQFNVDWKEFVDKATKKLEHYGKRYYIKNDLKKYVQL